MPSSDIHFPYMPLNPNARLAVFDILKEHGFPKTMIREDYPITGYQGREFRANAIAFTHETHRTPDHTGFSVFNTLDDKNEHMLADILARSAAPFHFIHRDSKKTFSFWFSNVRDRNARELESRRIESDIGYDNLSNALREYSEDLKRNQIINVKQKGEEFIHPRFRESGPFQLSLWATDVTGTSLVRHFGHAVNRLAAYTDRRSGKSIPKKEVTDIAIQILGAVILADTGTLGARIQQAKPGIGALIDAASRKFPNYFNTKLLEKWWEAADSAHEMLTELCYSGFSPEMLTNLYREAYPDKEDRKALGRYDTPLYLTRCIWNTIPVEFLPPEKRIVADMTCGWGSFLIAGYERMSRMIDMQGKSLRPLITGNDKDNFTARLAGLGLLISTSEDSWDIDCLDSEIWMAKKYGRTGPGIIVGNPPFSGDRKTISGEEHRYQLADKFMTYAINHLAPGGYLAMVMPQSFTISEASPILRRKLLEHCDVQEMWELPIGLFPDAVANTIVVFARKNQIRSRSAFPVRIRTLQKLWVAGFEETGSFTGSTCFHDQSNWNENSKKSKLSSNTHLMDFKLILPESSWQKIKSRCQLLSKISIPFTGAIIGDNPDNKSYKNFPSKDVDFLSDSKNVIKDSFCLIYRSSSKKKYPKDFERPRIKKENYLKGEKVLLTSNANPSWGKRVNVAIERNRHYVSENFIVIMPKPEIAKKHITHEVIAAVINWKVSNAWIIEHLKHPKIPMRAVKSIPFPPLNKRDCEILTEAVLRIENSFEESGESSEEALFEIDEVLKAAYALEDEEYDRLKSIYEWDTNPLITIDRQPDENAKWETTGVVDSVDAKNGTITLWLSDFDELQTVPISPAMPGWLLRPETAFRTRIPRECVRKRSLGNVYLGKFSPQDYTYLNEEELFDEISKILP